LELHIAANTGGRPFTFRRSLSMRAVSCPTERIYDDRFRKFVRYVDKIFKGTKPADIPVEQPTKFELMINLKLLRLLA
jgi:hypothetical protein